MSAIGGKADIVITPNHVLTGFRFGAPWSRPAGGWQIAQSRAMYVARLAAVALITQGGDLRAARRAQ